MNKTARLTVLALVFLLSTIFFWQAINNYLLLPSKAQLAGNMKIFISDKTIQCNTSPDAFCLVHIFGSTDIGVGVAGVSGALNFSENLNLIGITQEGFCGQAAYNLDAVLKYTAAPSKLNFSLGALRGDNQLLSGTKCITTVGFKRNVTTSNDTSDAKVGLADAAQWQAVGAQNLVPQVDTATVIISFSPSAPIPTITITPPVDKPGGGNPPITAAPTSGPAPTCSTKSKADCNCDGKVSVIDWEILRSAIRSEGKSCDPNDDGFVNSIDLSTWRSNHE